MQFCTPIFTPILTFTPHSSHPLKCQPVLYLESIEGKFLGASYNWESFPKSNATYRSSLRGGRRRGTHFTTLQELRRKFLLKNLVTLLLHIRRFSFVF